MPVYPTSVRSAPAPRKRLRTEFSRPVEVFTRARNDPREIPVMADCEATALRVVVLPPGAKAKFTVPEAVTRTALGTEVDVTVWMAPFWTDVAMLVKVPPLAVPRSTVSLENWTLLRVALPWTARVTAPEAPDS